MKKKLENHKNMLKFMLNNKCIESLLKVYNH